MYKMNNNISPAYLGELIPIHTEHRYHLRNADDIPMIHCRTQLYSNSFMPSAIREWNNLSEHTRNAPSLSSLSIV